MTREDIATERALRMHDLALAGVRSKGVPRLDGSTTVLEYRYGLLTIHYRSGVGALALAATTAVTGRVVPDS